VENSLKSKYKIFIPNYKKKHVIIHGLNEFMPL